MYISILKMKINRLVAEISEEEEQIVNNACNIDKRSKASLIRKAVLDYSNKVIEKCKIRE